MTANFDILEDVKENIQPVREGHPAQELARIFSTDSQELKEAQISEKEHLESLINNHEDLEDPLEPYVEYVKWINTNFPQGPTVANGLIELLETATDTFKDYNIYKNDPRYLKLWTIYASYSEDPISVFVYLHGRGIGEFLALYYEEYARHLEAQDRLQEADHVYQKGLAQHAEPVQRLRLKYRDFCDRCGNLDPLLAAGVNPFPKRQALALKAGSLATDFEETDIPEKPSKAEKFSVYVDGADNGVSGPLAAQDWHSFGTMASRTKENKLEAKPWAGQVLHQVTNKSSVEKFSVYKDIAGGDDGPAFKMIHVPGKNPEKLDINMDLLYRDNDEFCLAEVLAAMRGLTTVNFDILENKQQEFVDSQDSDNESLADKLGSNHFGLTSGLDDTNLDDFCSDNEEKAKFEIFNPKKFKVKSSQTISIKLNDENDIKVALPADSSDIHKSPTVTMTMFTKEASKEVYSMFNQKIGKVNLESLATAADHSLSNNLDDFTDSGISQDVISQNDTHHIIDNADDISRLENDVAELSVLEPSENEISHRIRLKEPKDPFFMTPIKRVDDLGFKRPLNDTSRRGSPFLKKKLKDVESGENSFLLEKFKKEEFEEEEKKKKEEGNKRKRQEEVEKMEEEKKIKKEEEKKIKKEEEEVKNRKQEEKMQEEEKNQEKETTTNDNVVDPFNLAIKKKLLLDAKSTIDSFKFLSRYNSDKSTLRHLKQMKVDNVSNKLGGAGRKNQMIKSSPKLITFEKTNEMYNVIKSLGEGGYGKVFLIESMRNNCLLALKVESPPNLWEFYVIQMIKQRLRQKAAVASPDQKESILQVAANSIIDTKGIHLYRDESYLILKYETQGTVIECLNVLKSDVSGSKYPGLNELVVVHFAVQLMRIVFYLHSVNIIHGDLKPDNCMVNFKKISSNSAINSKIEALRYLQSKSLTIIDFGRSIDLDLFAKETKFKAELQSSDSIECPQIMEGSVWKYEVDYFGLANVIHTMLFGNYIEIATQNGKYILKNKLKRYWKGELWNNLFDLLLNGAEAGETGLQSQIEKLEAYLLDEQNGFKHVVELQKIINDMEYRMGI